MTNTATTITIPRLPDESSRAYDARVAYVTMGPQRSIDKLAAGQKRGNGASRNRQLQEWSAQYGWVESARQYDEQVAFLSIQDAATQYRADLEEHRQRYQKAGRDLFTVASGLLAQCARAVRGEVIEDKHGNRHTIPAMELSPATVATAMRALTTAADLEAHALRLAEILPKLSDDVHD